MRDLPKAVLASATVDDIEKPNKEEPIVFQGDTYVDGSCVPLRHMPSSDRAGWAVVETDDHGEMLAALWGPVWAELPQSSPSAPGG